MHARSPAEERHAALRLTIIGVIAVIAGLAFWWLVEATNPSGDHDAPLVPLFASIPLLIGLYRLFFPRSRA